MENTTTSPSDNNCKSKNVDIVDAAAVAVVDVDEKKKDAAAAVPEEQQQQKKKSITEEEELKKNRLIQQAVYKNMIGDMTNEDVMKSCGIKSISTITNYGHLVVKTMDPTLKIYKGKGNTLRKEMQELKRRIDTPNEKINDKSTYESKKIEIWDAIFKLTFFPRKKGGRPKGNVPPLTNKEKKENYIKSQNIKTKRLYYTQSELKKIDNPKPTPTPSKKKTTTDDDDQQPPKKKSRKKNKATKTKKKKTTTTNKGSSSTGNDEQPMEVVDPISVPEQKTSSEGGGTGAAVDICNATEQEAVKQPPTPTTRPKNNTELFKIRIKFLDGSDAMKKAANEFQKELDRGNLKPNWDIEHYQDGGIEPEKIPPHRYSVFYFTRSAILNVLLTVLRFTKLRVLADKVMGWKSDEFNIFGSKGTWASLNEVRKNTIWHVGRTHLFRGIAAIGTREKIMWKYLDGLKGMISDDTDFKDEIDVYWKTDHDILMQQEFSSVEAHESLGPIESTEFYQCHKDKAGNLVCFWQTSGISYNFIVYPRSTPLSQEEMTDYGIEKADGTGWEAYHEWRKTIFEDDTKKAVQKQVIEFEKTLRKGNTTANIPHYGIRVYLIQKGDRLVFPAKDYKHGTIVPAQDSKRCLVIFYKIEPQDPTEK